MKPNLPTSGLERLESRPPKDLPHQNHPPNHPCNCPPNHRCVAQHRRPTSQGTALPPVKTNCSVLFNKSTLCSTGSRRLHPFLLPHHLCCRVLFCLCDHPNNSNNNGCLPANCNCGSTHRPRIGAFPLLPPPPEITPPLHTPPHTPLEQKAVVAAEAAREQRHRAAACKNIRSISAKSVASGMYSCGTEDGALFRDA